MKKSLRPAKQAGIGLVIDSDAVRAVAVDRKSGLAVTRAGEVPLAPGTVNGGEITDVAHVAEAIRELWRVGEFNAKDVNLAIGSPRVAIRPVDVPNMPDADLRSALKFQIGDHLPINPDDAIVDFQDLGVAQAGDETRAVLLVAAHRDLVTNAVQAANQAGLRVRRVDVIPLLLARVAAPLLPSAATTGEEVAAPGLEAIVDVGDDVTNVVLVYAGTAVFARTLGAGLGRDALAAGGDPAALADRLFPLMEEVRNTLAFAATQLRAGKVNGVLCSVPSAHERLLIDCLRATIGVPVHPLHALDVLAAYGGSSPYNLDRPFLAPTALALPAALRTDGHTPSLIPDVFNAGDARRRERLMLAGAVGVVAAGLAVVSFSKANHVSDLEAKAQAAHTEAATLQKSVASMAKIQADSNKIKALEGKLKSAVAGSIDYPRLLNEIADKLPTEAAIKNVTLARDSVAFSVIADSENAPTEILDAMDGTGRLHDVYIGAITINEIKNNPQTTFSVSAKPSAVAAADRLSQFGVK